MSGKMSKIRMKSNDNFSKYDSKGNIKKDNLSKSQLERYLKKKELESQRREEELSHESWVEAAQMEARRIVELLADDLPTIDVSVYGFCKTSIQLRKSGSNSIVIYVEICIIRTHNKDLDEWYNDYTRLEYSTYVTDNNKYTSNSIEELLSHRLFLEKLRKLL